MNKLLLVIGLLISTSCYSQLTLTIDSVSPDTLTKWCCQDVTVHITCTGAWDSLHLLKLRCDQVLCDSMTFKELAASGFVWEFKTPIMFDRANKFTTIDIYNTSYLIWVHDDPTGLSDLSIRHKVKAKIYYSIFGQIMSNPTGYTIERTIFSDGTETKRLTFY